MPTKILTIALLAALSLLTNCTNKHQHTGSNSGSLKKKSITKTVKAKKNTTAKKLSAKIVTTKKSVLAGEVGDDDLLEEVFSCRNDQNQLCFSFSGDQDDLDDLSEMCGEDDLDDLETGDICAEQDMIERCILSEDGDDIRVFSPNDNEKFEQDVLAEICGEAFEL